MTTACVPPSIEPYLVGAVPDAVRLVVWDGVLPAPAAAKAAEFFVPGYDVGPPDPAVLAELPAVRVVQLMSAGVEPWLAVVPEGTVLCSGRGIHGGSTAELAVGGLLSVLRELPRAYAAQAEHRWDATRTRSLAGMRVLVVGAGDIGRRIGAAVGVFDAEVSYVARTARDGVHATVELPELVARHDVLVLAVPHTADTDRLVDAALLAALPDGAIVVNVARGSVVDTDALLAELTAGRLSAFLDVTDPEPLPAEHPLWDAPNLVLTPHVGGGTAGWRRRAARLVADQLARYVAGRPLQNVVTDGY